MPQPTQTPPNHKAIFSAGTLRHALPEILAGLALLWVFHGMPGIIRHHWNTLAPDLRLLRTQSHWRIPPSKSGELKGMSGAIAWIRTNIPADTPLFYLGRMSRGIRLRYYTFPRAATWHYVYAPQDLVSGGRILEDSPPPFVVVDWVSEFKTLPFPDSWRKVYQDAFVVIFKVPGHVE